jgi:glycosyltransferase involved in cell wall biosynthesis
MRVPIVHVITKLELGGAQQNTLHTVGHLNRERFRPYLITGRGGLLDEEAASMNGVSTFFLPSLKREIKPLNDAAALKQIRAALRRIGSENNSAPLIVHTHSSKAGILGRWAAWMEGVPIILHTFHGFGFNDTQFFLIRSLFEAMERWTSRITTHFVVVSKANAQKAIRCGIASKERLTLIRSGIDLSRFQDMESQKGPNRRELGIDEGELVVTMVGCLKPQKAPLDFVRMARIVMEAEPKSRFFLIGDGILRPKVEKAARQLGLTDRFTLLGWRRDIPRILSASDVMVLTSLWEGLPRAIPEAMAAGLPVVATRVDGTPEAVKDGVNGYLVEPGDVNGLAQKTIEILRDRNLRTSMGREGKRRIGPFDIKEMVPRLEELYERLLMEYHSENRGPKWTPSFT